MNPREFIEVDPATFRVPTQRFQGADPIKLQRQIARHGRSLHGMPPVFVERGKDGELVLLDGVTRATLAAKLCPGCAIPAEVTEQSQSTAGHLPTIRDVMP